MSCDDMTACISCRLDFGLSNSDSLRGSPQVSCLTSVYYDDRNAIATEIRNVMSGSITYG